MVFSYPVFGTGSTLLVRLALYPDINFSPLHQSMIYLWAIANQRKNGRIAQTNQKGELDHCGDDRSVNDYHHFFDYFKFVRKPTTD
jgi:hypothetical protein